VTALAPDLLDRSRVTWAVGIEDTFVPQAHRRTGRALDEYELVDHYARYRDDLRLVADLGVRWMRYGIPWYRVNPEPGRFDWGWTDRVLTHMVESLGIRPIVDLVHYGCPTWLDGAFLHRDYPARVAEYAGAVADRYGGLVQAYPPLNEPVVNAIFCGRNAVWPPNRRSERGYCALVLALAAGIQRSIAAIRAAAPDALVVQVEASELLRADDPALAPAVEASLVRQFLPTDLVLGRVSGRHPAAASLLAHGATDDALAALRAGAQAIDVMGVNFYPHLCASRLEPGRNGARRRRFYATGDDLADVLAAYWRHFDVPVMLTETSDNARIARRLRWLDESVSGVRAARAAGVPVVGYTWWPFMSHVDWRYRRGTRARDDYWCHMGLYDLRAAPDGGLERVRTPVADRFAALVSDGASTLEGTKGRAA
jgi:beta-glucosidase